MPRSVLYLTLSTCLRLRNGEEGSRRALAKAIEPLNNIDKNNAVWSEKSRGFPFLSL
ncbi:MAG: hypothetical protein QXR69_00610 [Conexivisphaerales archaeon]